MNTIQTTNLMTTVRAILFCTLHMLQMIVRESSAVCDMSASVPLLFQDEHRLFGYGNSGLYRTDGVVLRLQCSLNHSVFGGLFAIQIFDQNNNSVANTTEKAFSLKRSEEPLNHTVFNIVPGSKFWCQCVIKIVSWSGTDIKIINSSSTIHVPSIQPCATALCEHSDDPVCYEKAGHVLKNQSPFFCETAALRSINWNLATSMHLWTDFLQSPWFYVWMRYISFNPHMALCTSRAHIPVTKCQVHAVSIPGIPPTATIETCNNDDFDATPMTLNGTMIHTGTTHYIEASEIMQLQVAAGYQKNPNYRRDTFECNMFTWKRGSDPRRGSNIHMIPTWHNENSIINKTWIIKGSDLHPEALDLITMIGCNQSSIWKVKDKFGIRTKQIEFFVRQFKKVSPIYDKSEKFMGCRTEIDGRALTTFTFHVTQSQCTCVFPPVYSCNPIKTIRNISGKVFPCTAKSDASGHQTSLNPAHPKPTGRVTKSEYAMIILGSFLAFFLIFFNITAILVCWDRRKRAKIVESVTARYELSEKYPPEEFNPNAPLFSEGDPSQTPVKGSVIGPNETSPINTLPLLIEPGLESLTLDC